MYLIEVVQLFVVHFAEARFKKIHFIHSQWTPYVDRVNHAPFARDATTFFPVQTITRVNFEPSFKIPLTNV